MTERDYYLTHFAPCELHDYVEIGGTFPSAAVARLAMSRCCMRGDVYAWPFDNGVVYRIQNLQSLIVKLEYPEIKSASARKSA